jgi:hypothetical protein
VIFSSARAGDAQVTMIVAIVEQSSRATTAEVGGEAQTGENERACIIPSRPSDFSV